MQLIISEEILRKYIPNAFTTVKGEVALFDKLAPQLQIAEDWVITNLTSASVLDHIAGLSDDNNTRTLTSQLIVAIALINAIPSLDLVLTPNGFGVVSNQNVAPASKERLERLIASLKIVRDDCILALLKVLPSQSDWLATAQAEFFGATLFPATSIVQDVGAVCASEWQKYLELRSQIIDLEALLADEWFSLELMSALRTENLRSTLTGDRKLVATQIKAQIIGYLRNGSFNSRRLADIVNFIRQRESEFPEWHSSDVAQLFSPPIFRNKKESKGYFF